MSVELYVNVDSKSVADSVVASNRTPSVPVSLPDLAVGENPLLNLFFVRSDGSFAPFSGDGTYRPRIGIGFPGANPDSGTFSLGFKDPSGNDDTASGISHDISAVDLQAVLENLSSIDAGEIKVTGQFPIYQIEFVGGELKNTDVDKFRGDGGELLPPSQVIIDETKKGGGGENEKQLIRLVRAPIALQDSWTTINNGFSARLQTLTKEMADLVARQAKAFTTWLVSIEDPNNNWRHYVQKEAVIRNEGVSPESLIPIPLSQLPGTLADDFVQNRNGLDGLKGGSVSDLDSLPTKDEAIGIRLEMRHKAGAPLKYRLASSPGAETLPWIVHPQDYDATDNDRGWILEHPPSLDGIPTAPDNRDDSKFWPYAVAVEGGHPTFVWGNSVDINT